jgi:hypothetical protein
MPLELISDEKTGAVAARYADLRKIALAAAGREGADACQPYA